jgi:hypothetical protein
MKDNYIHIRKDHKLELKGGSIMDHVKKHKSSLLKIAGGVGASAGAALIAKALLNGGGNPIDNEWVNLDLFNTPDGQQAISGNIISA